MTNITITSEKPIVVLEEAEYRRLLNRLEYLEDILDHFEEMRQYQRTGGVEFREFIDGKEE